MTSKTYHNAGSVLKETSGSAESGDNVRVAVRFRRLIGREIQGKLEYKWESCDSEIRTVDVPRRSYRFDHVFDGAASNYDVYDAVCGDIIESAFHGFNGTIFAYGQTSSGKTHTMKGTSSEQGVIPLAIDQIFDSIENSSGWQYLLRVSYLEIYNENVVDLLADPKDRKKNCNIIEDPQGNVIVVGAKEETVMSAADVMQCLMYGEQYRHVGETNMNDRSSRSHTIFRLIIESSQERKDDDDDFAIQVSHLNLVDLAGSERASQTGATGDRLREGGNINKSLMVLSQVIAKLSEGSSDHLPIRNSKLTRILKNSLGGNTKMAIICTATPVEKELTKSTLEFASRAKNIIQKAHVNEIVDDQALLKRLKKEIANLKNASKSDELTKLLRTRTEEIEETNRKNAELKEKIRMLQEQIVHSSAAEAAASMVELPEKEKRKKSNRRETWGGRRKTMRRMSFFPTFKLSDDCSEDGSISPISENNPLALLSMHENSILGPDGSFLSNASTFSLPGIDDNNETFQNNLPNLSSILVNDRRRRRTVRFANSPLFNSEPSETDTPKQVLRDKNKRMSVIIDEKTRDLQRLTQEFQELQDFTRFEEELKDDKESNDNNNNPELLFLLKNAEKSQKEMEEMYLKTNKDLHETKNALKEMEIKLGETIKTNVDMESLEKKISEIETDNKELMRENTNLKSEIKNNGDNILKNLEESVNSLRVEKEKHQNEINSANIQMDKLNAELIKLSEAYKTKEDNFAQVLAEKERISGFLEAKHSELVIYHQEFKKKYEIINSENRECNELKNEKLLLEQRLEEKEKEKESLISRVEELETAKSELDAKYHESEEYVTVLEHFSKSDKESIEEYRTEIDELKESLKSNEIIEEKNSLVSELEELNGKYRESKEYVIVLEDRSKSNQELISEYKAQIDKLQDSLKTPAMELNANLREELKTVKLKNAELTVKVNMSDGEKNKIKNELQFEKKQTARFKEQLRRVQNEKINTTIIEKPRNIPAAAATTSAATSTEDLSSAKRRARDDDFHYNSGTSITMQMELANEKHITARLTREIESLKRDISAKEEFEEKLTVKYKQWKTLAIKVQKDVQKLDPSKNVIFTDPGGVNESGNNQPLKENKCPPPQLLQ